MTKILGVTGGIGSGKSTVCDILESFGARIFRADDEAKRLMSNDPLVKQEIIASFGVNSYETDGSLNTVYLSEEIFSDPERVAIVNGIVHPRVAEAFADAVAQAKKDGVRMIAIEAALLFESGIDALVDMVVLIDSPPRIRVSRVVARDGVTPESVVARMSYQYAPPALRQKVDSVLHNNGTHANLHLLVAKLFRKMVDDVKAPT